MQGLWKALVFAAIIASIGVRLDGPADLDAGLGEPTNGSIVLDADDALLRSSTPIVPATLFHPTPLPRTLLSLPAGRVFAADIFRPPIRCFA